MLGGSLPAQAVGSEAATAPELAEQQDEGSSKRTPPNNVAQNPSASALFPLFRGPNHQKVGVPLLVLRLTFCFCYDSFIIFTMCCGVVL